MIGEITLKDAAEIRATLLGQFNRIKREISELEYEKRKLGPLIDALSKIVCPTCNGLGRVWELYTQSEGHFVECYACKGSCLPKNRSPK